jgi:hypothetical protein
MSGVDMSTTRTQVVVVATAPRRYALAMIGPYPRLYLIDDRCSSGDLRIATSSWSGTPPLSRNLLDELLRRHAGDLRTISQELGIARTRLYRLLKRWSLDPAEYRSGMHAAPPRNQS